VSDLTWLWLVAGVAFLITQLAAGAKAAFTHVRLPYLLSRRENEEKAVDASIALMEKSGMRTALRLGLAFGHFMFAGTLALALKKQFPEADLWTILLILVAALVLSFSFEFLLERQVLNDPETSALRWAWVARLIDISFLPASHLMMGILGDKAEKVTLLVTDEALRNWVSEDQPVSTLEKGEREMIYSIFRFSDTLAKDIMVPRMDLKSLDITTTIADARNSFIEAGHSRMPVYDDTIDDVVGLLHAKDLLSVVDGSETIASQRHLLRDAYFVPEAKKIDELLTEMQKKGIHMSLVVDEYGGVAGVVTLEDIVEEIIGEIRDEYDDGEEQLCEKLSENVYLFLGRATIAEFNDLTGANLSDEHADTLGGFIYGELGHVPQPGESVVNNGIEFIVEEVQARRILKVKVIKQDADDSHKLIADEENGNG
jgi:putative hemolysin